MSYVKANEVLPDNLIREIQKYIQGEIVYIPNTEGKRKKWGQNSGSRQYLKDRNTKIYDGYLLGSSFDELAEYFCLSVDSIRKIVYTSRKKDCN